MGSSSRPRNTLSTYMYHHDLKANQPEVSELNRLKVVHVAGIKGKGSTCTFVNSILLAHQGIHGIPHKIDLYTLPHLIAVRERIRINSEPIAEGVFAKYFFEVWDALEESAMTDGEDLKSKPVYFRFLTFDVISCTHPGRS